MGTLEVVGDAGKLGSLGALGSLEVRLRVLVGGTLEVVGAQV